MLWVGLSRIGIWEGKFVTINKDQVLITNTSYRNNKRKSHQHARLKSSLFWSVPGLSHVLSSLFDLPKPYEWGWEAWGSRSFLSNRLAT